MEKEQFTELLSKKLSGQIAEEDRILLEKMIDNDKECKKISVNLDNYFKEEYSKANISQLNQVWELIEANRSENFGGKFDYAEPKKNPFLYSSWLKIAAVLMVLIGTSITGYYLFLNNTNQNFETVIAINEKIFKVLDDGTKIWLNKNSTFSYNKAFGQQKREITLEGEAYFEVVKNSSVPLFIHARDIDIEVKGTAFNVNAYNSSNEIEVALVRGLIQVTDRLNHKRRVLLHPNEKLTFNNSKNVEQHNFLVKQVKTEILWNDTKWIADTLTFNKEKLKDLALRMEKKFDLKIEIQSEKLKEKRFSGTFINENIQQALEAIKLSYPLTYTINNRLVIIKDEK